MFKNVRILGMVIVTVGLAWLLLTRPSWTQKADAQGETISQAALDTGFTYQGRLLDGGQPANDIYDFQFTLFDAESAGAQVGSPFLVNNVTVTNGLFTVQLDFGGSAFNGDARWLEVGVRPGDSTGAYTILNPRQKLTAAPYAQYALHAPWSGLTGVPAGFADGVDHDTTSFWSLTGNAGADPSSQFIGTTDNRTLEFRVNNSRALRLEPNTISPNVVGGYSGNSVTSGVYGATIGGGGYSGYTNRVKKNLATVGGGMGNTAGSDDPYISDYQTVGGGAGNDASGHAATIAGGQANVASQPHTTVPGGLGAAATRYGEMAYASGVFNAVGDAQTSVYVLRNTTTDGSPTDLFLDGLNFRIQIPNNRAMTFDMLVVGRSNTNLSAGYRIWGVIENDNWTIRFVGASGLVFGEDDPAWDAVAVEDQGHYALGVRVTGKANTTIRWVAVVRTAEVGW